MHFFKMQGLGNDYIFIDCTIETVVNPETLAVVLSKPHFGVGADGLILIRSALQTNAADCRMEMYNADGSRGEMCGNGIRCVGRYVVEKGLKAGTIAYAEHIQLLVETDAGIKNLVCHVSKRMMSDEETQWDEQGSKAEYYVSNVSVDMGIPSFALKDAGIDERGINRTVVRYKNRWYSKIALEGLPDIIPVSLGNPHAVVFCNQLDGPDVSHIGPAIENNPCFSNRTNVEFVKVVDKNSLELRVWERGSGETLSCGTGACAAVAAAVLEGLVEPDVKVLLPGGQLHIRWHFSNQHIIMSGPAVCVFEGVIDL